MTSADGVESVVDKVAELLHLRIGLRSDHSLRGRLRRAIRDEAVRHGDDPALYAHRLHTDSEALQRLLNRVTVQETGFFRHPEQFEALARVVLPALRGPVKIWSAGCANGQEAYSLAMTLEEHGVDGSVVATDLSTTALRRTAAALYTGRELAGLSPERRSRHLVRSGDAWQVAEPVRRRVSVHHHNMVDPLPGEVRPCQVVFCRNVLIYLSPGQVRLFLDRVADLLGPRVSLFVGSAETVWQVSDRFEAVQAGGSFIYRPRPEVLPPPAPSATPDVRPERAAPRRPNASQARRRDRARPERVRTSRSEPRGPGERVHRAAAASGATQEVDTDVLEKTGQEAMAVGDVDTAVVAFRKCAYLRPHDPLAHLHLGLALEAAGDEPPAHRAFAAARRALLDADSDPGPMALEGWSADELLRFLESKS